MTTTAEANGQGAMVRGALPPDAGQIEAVLLSGDINRLDPKGKVQYYMRVCESLGLNPLTQPFEFIVLSGKMRFYATKACTEQLRKINGVSLTILSREVVEGCYVVTARAQDKWGRADESLGAVPIENLKGESRSNAMMKAETKAKRRVTLSICGLGLLDESESESIPGAIKVPAAAVAQATADLKLDASVTQLPADPDKTPGPTEEGIHVESGEAPNPAELAAVRDAAKVLKWSKPKATSWLKSNFGQTSADALTKDQCSSALALLMAAQLDDNDDAYAKVYDRLKAEGKVGAS